MGKKVFPETMTLIRDNIMTYDNPLAVSAKENAAWAVDLQLPKRGELLFYTGGEYQLLPFIDSLMGVMDIVDPGSKPFAWLMSMRNLVNKTGLAPEKVFATVFAQDKERFFSINKKAAQILQKLGYFISYDGENEIYSGALLHEMGFDAVTEVYSKRVGDFVRGSGAKTVICMSPHAAEVFKLVYPQYGNFPEVEVRTFIEMVHARRDRLPKSPFTGTAVIHDSCRMARELGFVDELREVLDAMGVKHVEPFRFGAWTTCCGGPIKTTYPELAHKLAVKRYKELAETGAQKALISCPFCLSALKGGTGKGAGGMEVEDFVELIARGYGL